MGIDSACSVGNYMVDPFDFAGRSTVDLFDLAHKSTVGLFDLACKLSSLHRFSTNDSLALL